MNAYWCKMQKVQKENEYLPFPKLNLFISSFIRIFEAKKYMMAKGLSGNALKVIAIIAMTIDLLLLSGPHGSHWAAG